MQDNADQERNWLSCLRLGWVWAAGWLCLGLLLGLVVPWLGPRLGIDPAAIDRSCLRGCSPGAAHWLGTDTLGRDVLAQLLYGTRTALWGGLLATGIAGTLGFGLGAAAAWQSRAGAKLSFWVLAAALLGLVSIGYCLRYLPSPGVWVVSLLLLTGMSCWLLQTRLKPSRWGLRADRLLLFLVEILRSVPALLLLLALTALTLQPGLPQMILLFAGLITAGLASLSLQEVRHQLQRPYVEAAHFAGMPTWRLLSGHIFPNVLPAFSVELVLAAAGFVLMEGAFSFLGLGLPATTPSWGHLLAETRSARAAWWLWLYPGLALVGTVLALQVLGRELRRRRAGTGGLGMLGEGARD